MTNDLRSGITTRVGYGRRGVGPLLTSEPRWRSRTGTMHDFS